MTADPILSPPAPVVYAGPNTAILADVSKVAKNKGFRAIALINQGGREPFVAACMDGDGRVCDPRSYDTHATPEGALEDLFARLSK